MVTSSTTFIVGVNLWMMVGVGFLVILLVFGLFVFLRKSDSN
jgi:hypothetical protein